VDNFLIKKGKQTTLSNYKNELKKSILKMTDKMQILVIGCINIAPPKITAKDLDIFVKKIFFPLPQFSDLKLIWKHYLEQKGAVLPNEFRLDSLADISYG